MTTKIPVFLFSMLIVASSLEAQTPSDWTRKVKAGKAVFVTTTAGEEIAGKAGPMEGGTMTVLTAAGPRRVALADMQKVQQHDRPWTGAVAGAVFGGLTASMGVARLCEDDPRVGRDPACNMKTIAPGVATYVGVPALIGWGIDVLVKKRRTLHDGERRYRASVVIKGRMVGLAIAF